MIWLDTQTVILLVSLLVTAVTGFLGLGKFVSDRIDRVETGLKDSLGARIDSVETNLSNRMDRLENDHKRLEERVFRLAVGWPQEPLENVQLPESRVPISA